MVGSRILDQALPVLACEPAPKSLFWTPNEVPDYNMYLSKIGLWNKDFSASL